MRDFCIQKTYVRLVEDYLCDFSNYPEENCFLPIGTEGVILTVDTIELIPNLSDEKRIEILNRMHGANLFYNSLLLVICNRVVKMPVSYFETVRIEGGPKFENAQDVADYLEKMLGARDARTT